MQRLEVSGAVLLIYKSLGVKGLNHKRITFLTLLNFSAVKMCFKTVIM